MVGVLSGHHFLRQCKYLVRDINSNDGHSYNLCQSGIDLHHLPRISLFSAHDSFYVQASVDDHGHKTTTAEKPHSLPWTMELKL